MKCQFCGGTEFSAHQVCRLDVVVDGNGSFLRNLHKDVTQDIYDSETPYGPFRCTTCGAEYDGDSLISATLTEQPREDWSKDKSDLLQNLRIMTIDQLAEHLASQLNYDQIWRSSFPSCDFSMLDIDVEQREYSIEELNEIHANASGWYGIRAADFKMDSTTLFVVADLFGGGCDQVKRLYDGIGRIEAEILLREAIKDVLKSCGNDIVLNDTSLIVEFVNEDKED